MMDMSMGWLHAGGYTIDDIKNGFKDIPIDKDTIDTIRKYHALGCKMYIVSDANSMFIDTVLDNLELKHCFDEIHTNPVSIKDGRLRIKPYHDDRRLGPHRCKLCRRNICKGMILDSLPIVDGKPRVYLGDGKGDYCAIMRLNEQDHALVRRGYPLENVINENDVKPKAHIHYWTTGKDISNYLDQLTILLD
jgi:2,3-diketo-5-methylthio-1-phosphopentane phosphatase